MEFVYAIIGPIVESLIVPVKKQLGYFFLSTQHVRNMNTKMKELDDTSSDVKNQEEHNKMSNLEIPHGLQNWLKEVEETKKKAQSFSSTGGGCYNMKMRYRVGRHASKIVKEIESLTEKNSKIIWRNTKIPLGKVKSNITSTSAPSDNATQNHFKSRENSFKDALESLQHGHMSKVIALCGMGGVGKTTMMEQLKKAVEDKKMFDYVVKVVIGQQVNMFSIQQAVAEYMGQSLTETSKTTRADRLRIIFQNLPEDKRKVLLILDDVWETIELEDIGLSPLPISFKLLLTSRNEIICNTFAVEANSDLKLIRVGVMEEAEAHNFFWQITGVSERQELNQIGSDIVRRCGFLPLAIKLIAATLKSQKAHVWRNTLRRLKKNNLDYVQKIIEISYNNIKEEEEKAIFLLCGLFPEDFNIPIEELTRIAWGLQLLSEVSTLGDARDMTRTCVQNLTSAHLLMDSDYIGCVKMHDLVLAFVLSKVSKGDHPWIINHGEISKWVTTGISDACKKISITCSGMSEFPRDFRYPNISLLRLMDGDKSLRFPEDFYGRMENLEVVAYENMQYMLLPRSLECCTKLRTLLLHQCLLMFDYSALGELLNLEVLSFSHCGIKKLPSTIGKLEKLKLLDLTGCVNLRIDDGVLKNLVKLEELYMRVDEGEAICFTDGNRVELAELSERLSALEVEFFDNNDMPENMLFTELTRFRISMGRGLEDSSGLNMHSFENTLELVMDKEKLLKCGVNELFKKTEKLYLEVDGMIDLKEILVKSVQLPVQLGQSFNNLRVLKVFKCANLRYLFTVPMANGLMNLEHLAVSQCPVLEVVVYSENGRSGAIKFQELKVLSLFGLPKLEGLCNTVNVIELPQLVKMRLDGLPNFTSIYPENTSATSSMSSNVSENQPFFNKEVLIPKLEILKVKSMNKLREIWPHQVSSSDKVDGCMLREIKVMNCDNLVNMFPENPMSLLRHLKELSVSKCGSIEVLFNIDMSCVGEIEEYRSNLRYIQVSRLGKLRELWRMKGESSFDMLICSFQAIEGIYIDECESFLNIFTPTITNPDTKTLMKVSIDGKGPWEECERNIELVEQSQEINAISKTKISEVYGHIGGVEFSVHPTPSFYHLKRLTVLDCNNVEVVFEIEGSNSRNLITNWHNHQPLLLPYLELLHLQRLNRMSHVWKCNWNELLIPQNQSQSSFHNLTTIIMLSCHSIKYLFSPLMSKLLPNLKEVEISYCDGIEEVVSIGYGENDEMTTSISSHTNTISFPCLKTLILVKLPNLKAFFLGMNEFQLPLLEKFKMYGCPQLMIFTSGPSMAPKLNYIHTDVGKYILECGLNFKLSVATHEGDQFPWSFSNLIAVDGNWQNWGSRVMFPCNEVPNLKNLEKLYTSFTHIEEIFEVVEGTDDDVNEAQSVVVIEKLKEVTLENLYRLKHMWKSNRWIVLNFPNLTKVSIEGCGLLGHVFTSCMVGSLLNLQELNISDCKNMDVIVKEVEDSETSATEVVFPSLKSVTLETLPFLKGFCLGKADFQWPSLDTLEIRDCPEITLFTCGQSTTPKLKLIETTFGLCHATEDLNSFINTKKLEGWQF